MLTNKQEETQREEIEMKDIKEGNYHHRNDYYETKNPDFERIEEYDNDPLPKDKLKIVAFIFVYTVIVLLTKGDSNF